MYDDDDHQARDEHDFQRRSSRSPPRGPRGEQPYSSSYNERRHGQYQHDNTFNDETRSRQRAVPSYGRDRDHGYRDHDAPYEHHGRRTRRNDDREPSPYNSGDDGYYQGHGQRSGPGRPSHTLKLNDIPDWMNRQVIDQAMRDAGAGGLVEVRVKADDRSRRAYGFAEFRSENEAAEFLENNYPAFEMHNVDGSTTRIYLEYSRERRQAAPPDDWVCTMCYFENFSKRTTCKECKAPRSADAPLDMRLDGQSDECPQQTPSPFVVVRGLASSVNEISLANGIKSLYVDKTGGPKQGAPGAPKLKSTAPVGNTSGLGAKPGSLARVFMIRDKSTEISCNYGFAEFSTLEDARAAMAKYHASPTFLINSRPASVAFIHSGVFIPYLHQVQGEDERFTFTALHNPSMRLSYWNPTVYASELTMLDENLYDDKPEDSNRAKKESEANAAKESKKRKADKELTGPTGKKAIAMAPQLQMWANKHAELAGPTKTGKTPNLGAEFSPATGVNAVGGPTAMTPAEPAAVIVSYADLDDMCCLLCRRRFKSEPSLRRHEQLSDMHKTNLESDATIAKATQDLKARGKEPVSNYRDRAKERRLAHKKRTQPKAAQLPKKNQGDSAAGKTPEAPKPAISKGAGLLAKMGWTTGAGLGAGGEGRTNIIETLAYTPGVGLGAEGGKAGDAVEEAARATKNDYSDFVSKAKDKARERYERLN